MMSICYYLLSMCMFMYTKNGINQFTCDCEAGWTGNICDINIDDCEPNPCLNGANCTVRKIMCNKITIPSINACLALHVVSIKM